MIRSIILLLLLIFAPLTSAEMIIIAHPDSSVDKLSKKQLIDLYMGKVRHLPNGDKVKPLDQADDSEERKEFYYALTGKSLAQVNAYWARLIFVGRAVPPKTLDSSEKIIQTISENPASIGYISKSDLVEGVKVIAHVE